MIDSLLKDHIQRTAAQGVHGIDLSDIELPESPTFVDVTATGKITVSGAGSSLAQEAWIAVSFQNSWVDFDTGLLSPAGYFKDSLGIVHLRGCIKSGTLNTAAFTLPAGYRPSKRIDFLCPSNLGVGYLIISPDGIVNPYSGSNVTFHLPGVSFPTTA